MIRAALAALGVIAICSGVTMAEVAWAAQHLVFVDRGAVGVAAVGGVLLGLELLLQLWRYE